MSESNNQSLRDGIDNAVKKYGFSDDFQHPQSEDRGMFIDSILSLVEQQVAAARIDELEQASFITARQHPLLEKRLAKLKDSNGQPQAHFKPIPGHPTPNSSTGAEHSIGDGCVEEPMENKDNFIRDVTKVHPLSKSEVRRRLEALIHSETTAATKKVTRFEVIDHTKDGKGRVFVKGATYGDPIEIDLLYQDDGRTLKVRVTDRLAELRGNEKGTKQ